MSAPTTGSFDGHWFEPLAEVMGPSYLRYSFTKGTEQEVAFLIDVLSLTKGDAVLDVGCGPGRHSLAFARHGVVATGVDISQHFVDLANASAEADGLTATFARIDARNLDFDGQFDAVVSLCQGGFGLLGRDEDGAADGDVLARMARALKPGGRLALSAFSAYFQLRHLETSDTFDAATGVNHEATEVRGDGAPVAADLWTTCFTPRELRLLAERAGLRVDYIWSVTPGRYERNRPIVDLPEFLLVAHRPD
jgi:SAM-dependent methyltransferase